MSCNFFGGGRMLSDTVMLTGVHFPPLKELSDTLQAAAPTRTSAMALSMIFSPALDFGGNTAKTPSSFVNKSRRKPCIFNEIVRCTMKSSRCSDEIFSVSPQMKLNPPLLSRRSRISSTIVDLFRVRSDLVEKSTPESCTINWNLINSFCIQTSDIAFSRNYLHKALQK